MRNYIYIILCCFLLLNTSCEHPKPKKDNVIGVWISGDGAELDVKRNGEVTLTNIPMSLINSNLKELFTGKGKWEIRKSESISPFWIFDVVANNNLDKKNSVAIELLISRSGLGGSGSEITTLFIWKGDPDLDDRYEFKKQ